jgi:hypothetical protein
MTAIVTVANRKPMSLNPLRSAIAMLRLTEKSNVGAEKTFLKNCGCEYCVKVDLQPLLPILAESRRQLDAFFITLTTAPDWADFLIFDHHLVSAVEQQCGMVRALGHTTFANRLSVRAGTETDLVG